MMTVRTSGRAETYDTFSFHVGLYRYACEYDGSTQPLGGSEFVVVDDDGQEHGEEFSGEGDRPFGGEGQNGWKGGKGRTRG